MQFLTWMTTHYFSVKIVKALAFLASYKILVFSSGQVICIKCLKIEKKSVFRFFWKIALNWGLHSLKPHYPGNACSGYINLANFDVLANS